MPPDIRRSHVLACHYGPTRLAGYRAAIDTPATPISSAANAQTATQAQGPNPLWAINIGMGVFLAATALVVVLG